jgi:hydrogenase nickel incorporation protein HypA/HybF
MHEVSLVHALFDQADRALGAHPPSAVRRIQLRVGALAGVEPELFETAFQGVREERGYAAAVLELLPAAGTELVLERLELEVPDV